MQKNNKNQLINQLLDLFVIYLLLLDYVTFYAKNVSLEFEVKAGLHEMKREQENFLELFLSLINPLKLKRYL